MEKSQPEICDARESTEIHRRRRDESDHEQHVAEQVKIDKGENVVMDEPKIGEFGRIERQQNLMSIARDGVKFGKVGKLENCKFDEEMCRRSEEKLCKSILKGLAKHSREKHAMLADVEEGTRTRCHMHR